MSNVIQINDEWRIRKLRQRWLVEQRLDGEPEWQTWDSLAQLSSAMVRAMSDLAIVDCDHGEAAETAINKARDEVLAAVRRWEASRCTR